MINKEVYEYEGVFVFEVTNILNGDVSEYVVHNRIVNNTINTFANCLIGPQSVDLEIKFLAVGTDDSAVSDTSTTLGAEIKRVQPEFDPVLVSTGRVETTFALLKTDAVAHIKEVGIFVGATATITANSGVLHTRVLWDYDKTINEEIIIKRIDIIKRG